jgi:hypothetical protein
MSNNMCSGDFAGASTQYKLSGRRQKKGLRCARGAPRGSVLRVQYPNCGDPACQGMRRTPNLCVGLSGADATAGVCCALSGGHHIDGRPVGMPRGGTTFSVTSHTLSGVSQAHPGPNLNLWSFFSFAMAMACPIPPLFAPTQRIVQTAVGVVCTGWGCGFCSPTFWLEDQYPHPLYASTA